MAEVKWIKLQVGMFDGMSFKKIRKAKIGGESFRDKLTAVWFELMDFAGQCNHDGAFISPHEIPFHDLFEIAVMIDREEEELNLCMSFFIKEGMITVVDDIYMLTNWERYQNTDGLEKIREQNRLAQQRSRARKKLLEGAKDDVNDVSRDSHVTVTVCHDIEEEGELEKEKESHSFILSREEDEEGYIERKVAESGLEGEDAEEYKDYVKERLKVNVLRGDLGKGVVRLSGEQIDDLLDKLSIDEFNKYVAIVADCELNGKPYKKKTHYQAILEMAQKDRRIR